MHRRRPSALSRPLASRLVALVLAGCACVGPAQADDAALTCDKDVSFLPFAVLPEARAGVAPTVHYSDAERQCWLTLDEADAWVQAHQAQWVDVREAGLARSLAPQGVPQVAISSLGHRAFLKGLPLVLIGSDVDLKPLSAQCLALRASGHFADVKVLVGGMRAWERAGRPVLRGGKAQQTDPALVSAQEAWIGAGSGVWQIVAVGLDEAGIAQLPQSPAVRIPAQNPDEAWRAIEAQLRRAALQTPRQWLIVAATPQLQAQLMRAWRKALAGESASQTQTPKGLAQATWLGDGLPAYLNHLQQQRALALNAGRSLPRICGM
jgi:rhodanese-related sulfurtransferase